MTKYQYKIEKRVEFVDFPHFGKETNYWVVKFKFVKFLFWKFWVHIDDVYWSNNEQALRKFAAAQNIQLSN